MKYHGQIVEKNLLTLLLIPGCNYRFKFSNQELERPLRFLVTHFCKAANFKFLTLLKTEFIDIILNWYPCL